MTYNVVLVSTVQKSDPVIYIYIYIYIERERERVYMCIYIFFFIFFSIIAYHRLLTIVPCAIQ